MTDRIRDLLRKVWLFEALSEEELAKLERKAVRQSFARHAEVVHQNDNEDTKLYCVVRGHLKVTTSDPKVDRGEGLLLNLLKAGDHIGEIALLDGAPRSASVVAMDSVELLSISRADFFETLKISHDPADMRLKLMRTMAKRIRLLSERVQDCASLPVPARLAKRLNELADTHGDRIDAKRVLFKIKLSQQDLGDLVQATRESVNKCMRQLVAEQIVGRERGRILIIDRLRLQLKAQPPGLQIAHG
ncbi:MAG: cyclic receptor protein [Pseudomonadota bacterium]